MPQTILKAANKARLTGTLLLVFLGSHSYAGDVMVTIEGINATAPLHAALADARDKSWPLQPLKVVSSDSNTLRFVDVAPGQYAVQVFQDLNGNGELEQSRRGIPQEPVGFSGNPSLFSGKPSPGKAKFEHGTTDTQVSIRLHQPRKRNGLSAPATNP